MTILLTALTLLFLLVCWMRIELGVSLVLILLPAYLLRAELFGIPTTLLELILLSLIAVWFIRNHHRLRELVSLDRAWATVIALLLLAATISAVIAPDPLSALGIWKAYFIEPILFFYLLKDQLHQGSITSTHVTRSLLLGGVWVSLLALIQWVFHTGIPIPWDIERRVTGVFDYPNALGLYLGPLAVMAFTRVKFWYVGTVFVLAIVAAQSEAALAALFVTLTLAGLSQTKFRKQTGVIVMILLIAGLTIPSSRSYLMEKIALQDYSGQVRLSQWEETWELLKDRPILGTGLSGYPSALVPYHQAKHLEIFQYPHNIFLNIWVELGLLGMIAFLFLVFLLLRSSRVGTTLLLLPLLQMFLHGLVDVPYFKNDLAILTWTLLALVYAQSFSKTKSHV